MRYPYDLAVEAQWFTQAGNSKEVLHNEFPSGAFDAVVTDPPYEIGISGKDWDRSGIAWDEEFWFRVYQVLKPGGYLISFAATRTYHRMATAVENAGFEVRDMITWLYGQGNPMATPLDPPFEDWASRLKPACEPMVVARRPLSESTLQGNMERHGVGAVHIEEGRVGDRYPANVVMDDEAGALIDAQAKRGVRPSRFFYCSKPDSVQKDAGLAAGGFEVKDRDTFTISGTGSKGYNLHPTVKPVDLMRWLIRLYVPRGGVVLDPFLGSGTTGIAAAAEGCRFVGIDLDPEYVRLADARFSYMLEGGQI